LYAKTEDGGKGLKNSKEVYEVYDETKVMAAWYMATSNNKWIKV
jgi:hypothetical protein